MLHRRAFDLLTPHERERALRTNVVYATHPFRRLLLIHFKLKSHSEWGFILRFRSATNSGDGLRCYGDADDISDEDDQVNRVTNVQKYLQGDNL